MKKALCLFLALILAAACCAASIAESLEEAEFPYVGFRIVMPETYRNTKGIVTLEGPYDLSEIVQMINCGYAAMTKEKYDLIMDGSHEQKVPPEEILIDTLFTVFAIGKGQTFSWFNTVSQFGYNEEYAREIGQAGDTTFYLYMEGVNEEFVADIDSIYRDEYIAMASAWHEVAASFTFFEPQEQPDPYARLVGSHIDFVAADLDGKPVFSEDLFAQNDITVLNVWATWCGPCVGELEELQSFHKNMQKKGIGVVGLLVDDDVAAARELLDEFGVQYPVILAPENLDDLLYLEGYPTTFFIDRDGRFLALPVVGAYVGRYTSTVNELLRTKK